MYIYCIEMKRSKEEFWNSTMAENYKMIDIYYDDKQRQICEMKDIPYDSKYFKSKKEVNEEPELITSMSQLVM